MEGFMQRKGLTMCFFLVIPLPFGRRGWLRLGQGSRLRATADLQGRGHRPKVVAAVEKKRTLYMEII